ncbi:alpha/beta fold hydrolase [Streptomyces sp. NPDC001816]|uniref:alpha/beta fold hydrolase n=1 Tax=Streptomyces sp. NPDC001816 TaxID=3364612 RepID=UPI003686EF1E
MTESASCPGRGLAVRRCGCAGTPVTARTARYQGDPTIGDLGGLTAHRRLIRLDLRRTGRSARPEDSATYRCDRLVDDVEALRRHLGLDRIDLLAHSAGANLAVSYVSRHPERVGRLALITPSVLAVGVAIGRALSPRPTGDPAQYRPFPVAGRRTRFAATVTNFLNETKTL